MLIVATTYLCVAAGDSSVLDLDGEKKELEERGRNKDREWGRVRDRRQTKKKERNTLGKNDMAQRQGGH